MDEERTLLKIGLGILTLLIVLVALWRVLSYQPNTKGRTPSSVNNTQGHVPSHNLPVSEQSMVALLEEPSSKQIVADTPPAAPAPSSFVPYKATPSQAVAYPKNRATAKQPYPSNVTGSKRQADTNSYTPATKATSYQSMPATYQPSGYVSPQGNFNMSSSERMREERARMLAPYLRPNQQDKVRMDEQWNKMFAGLQRAIAKALMPKSKREEMIEKYAAKPTQTQESQVPGFTGSLAPVGQQVAEQKQLMVQQMGQAFGSAAAQEAGGIMDSFAGELSAALNSPNVTAAQKEQKVKELTKKYQDKMDKLAEKKQYDKFVAQRTEEINRQKEAFRSQYGGELSNQLAQNLEEEWQEEQNLALQNLPQEEYYKQQAQLHQNKRDERQKMVLAQGQSINPMLELEKKQEEEFLKNLQSKVDSGELESVAREATFNEMQSMKANVKAQYDKTMENIANDPLLGPQAKPAFEPIFEDYKKRREELYQKELSIKDRRDQEDALLKDVNRQLLDKQIELIEKKDIPEVQKQQILEELRQAYNVL